MDSNGVIKFYAGDNPEMFEIERRCMDRDGKVVEYLNNSLSNGLILDVGAGNGFTADKLITKERLVIPMEPDGKIIDINRKLVWVRGVAQDIPFHNQVFDGAYSTWAFFFPGMDQEIVRKGIDELNRVTKKGSRIFIVDNAGDDEFTALNSNGPDYKQDLGFWRSQGFEEKIIETSFKFDNNDEARKLFRFYFGEKGESFEGTEIQYRVAVYECQSLGA